MAYDPNWHIAFMADEANLARLWAEVSHMSCPDDGYTEEELDKQMEFLIRTWPVEGDLDSLERYVERCKEFVRNADPGNTFLRRWVDYVPALIAEIRTLRAERATPV